MDKITLKTRTFNRNRIPTKIPNHTSETKVKK